MSVRASRYVDYRTTMACVPVALDLGGARCRTIVQLLRRAHRNDTLDDVHRALRSRDNHESAQ